MTQESRRQAKAKRAAVALLTAIGGLTMPIGLLAPHAITRSENRPDGRYWR